VPQQGVFPIDPQTNFSFLISQSDIAIDLRNDPFSLKITRSSTGATLFNTQGQDLIFSEHYLEWTSQVDSEHLYGIGERFQQGFRKGDGKWTNFNRDRGKVIDHGTGLQTYGYYPFYLLKEQKNLFHINYLRSSNALDIIKSTKEGKHYITYKIIGGIFDFRFFLGEEDPESLFQRLHKYSGASAIPPFWSLGFHQCKHGYQNITYLDNVVKGYEENGLPLDTIWTDIEYMVGY
jgi:alpha-glucosidase